MNDKDSKTEASSKRKSDQGKDKNMSATMKTDKKQSTPSPAASGESHKDSSGAKNSEQTAPTASILSLQKFLSESAGELRKITWPDRQQVIRETGSVIFLVALITIVVLGFDYGLAKVVFEPLDHLARQFGGGIGSHH